MHRNEARWNVIQLRSQPQASFETPLTFLWRHALHALRHAVPVHLDPSPRLLNPSANADHTVRRVQIPLGNGFMPGHLFVPRHDAKGASVCLVHGTSAEQTLSYYMWIRALLRAGFQVLTFEMDGHGDNRRPLRVPDVEANVPAALQFLRSQPGVNPARLGLLGVSLGGACALNALPAETGIKAVVAVSVPAQVELGEWERLQELVGLFNPENCQTFLDATPGPLLRFVTVPVRIAQGLDALIEEVDLLHPKTAHHIDAIVRHLDPYGRAARSDVPVMVINGDWDNITPLWQAQMLYERISAPKSLLLVPRRNHFTIMISPQAVDGMVQWFRRWL